MTDQILLMIGCVITFIAAAGAYVALRSGFAHDGLEGHAQEKTQRSATTAATADAR